MIKTKRVFIADCDNCSEQFIYMGDTSLFHDEGSLKDCLMQEGWHYNELSDECYCAVCYGSISEDKKTSIIDSKKLSIEVRVKQIKLKLHEQNQLLEKAKKSLEEATLRRRVNNP